MAGKEQERSTSGSSAAVVAAAAVAALTTVGLHLRMGAVEQQVQVPELVGLSIERAKATAVTARLIPKVTGTAADPVIPLGAVAQQDPLAGTHAPSGAIVTLTISEGSAAPHGADVGRRGPTQSAREEPRQRPEPSPQTPDARLRSRHRKARQTRPRRSKAAVVTVPKVTGRRLRFAAARLQARGLGVGRVTYGYDEDHIDGYVLRQSPDPGTSSPRGTTVDLVVNRLD
jgi:beta-lactam-binding protein with PASTA domain